MKYQKQTLLVARFFSLLFSPFYFPTIAFIALIHFSYLHLLPWISKVFILALVYLFTVAIPSLSIFLYRYINGWAKHELGRKERRLIPYLMSILSYGTLFYLLNSQHMPRYMLGIIVGALVVQIVAGLLTPWIKLCTHTMAAGGVIGSILAFSLLFRFDPTLWICITVLIAGIVASSRIILRYQNLIQVTLSICLGICSGFLSILLT